MPRTKKNAKSKEEIEELRRQLNIPGTAGTIPTAPPASQMSPEHPVPTRTFRKRNAQIASPPPANIQKTIAPSRGRVRKAQSAAASIPQTEDDIASELAQASSSSRSGAPTLDAFMFHAPAISEVSTVVQPARASRGRPKKVQASTTTRRTTRNSSKASSVDEEAAQQLPPEPPPPPHAILAATRKTRPLNAAQQESLSTIKSTDSEAEVSEEEVAEPSVVAFANISKCESKKKKKSSQLPANEMIPARDFISSSPVGSPLSAKKGSASSSSKKGSALEGPSFANSSPASIIPALALSLTPPSSRSSPSASAFSPPAADGRTLNEVASSIVPALGLSPSLASPTAATAKRSSIPIALPKAAPSPDPSPFSPKSKFGGSGSASGSGLSSGPTTGRDIIPALSFKQSPLRLSRGAGAASRLPQSPLASRIPQIPQSPLALPQPRPASSTKLSNVSMAAASKTQSRGQKMTDAARTLDDLVDSMAARSPSTSPLQLRARANSGSADSSLAATATGRGRAEQQEQDQMIDEEMEDATQSRPIGAASSAASSSKASKRSIVLLDAPIPPRPKSALNTTFTIPKTPIANPMLKQSYLLPSAAAAANSPCTVASGQAFPRPPRPPKIPRMVPLPMEVDLSDADGDGYVDNGGGINVNVDDVVLPDADECDLELDRAAAEEKLSLPLTMEVDAEVERVFCVLDTNVFIDWLPFLDALFTQAIAEQSLGAQQSALSRLHLTSGENIRCHFVLPWKLMSELDYQHSFGLVPHASQFPGSASGASNGGGRSGTLYCSSADSRTLSQMELKEKARLALACIREHLRQAAAGVSSQARAQSSQTGSDATAPHNAPVAVIVAQTIREDKEACEKYRGINNDDHILLCTLALTDRYKSKARVVLVSSDMGLTTKSIANAIECIDARGLAKRYFEWESGQYAAPGRALQAAFGSAPSSSAFASSTRGPERVSSPAVHARPGLYPTISGNPYTVSGPRPPARSQNRELSATNFIRALQFLRHLLSQ